MSTISVLIPAYNVEAYIARCLDSVLAQSELPAEILVLDDGSQDATHEICAGYAAKHEIIHCIASEHQGVSFARESLLAQAKGNFIFFLDSDDYLESDCLEYLLTLSRRYDGDIVQCSMAFENMDGSRTREKDEKVVVLEGRSILNAYNRNFFSPRCMLAAKLYKRSVIQDVHFPPGKIHEDEFVMPNILNNCRRFVLTDRPLYHYCTVPNSIMRSKFSMKRCDGLEALQQLIGFFEVNGYDEQAKIAKVRYCLQVVRMVRQINAAYTDKEKTISDLMDRYRKTHDEVRDLPILSERLKNYMESCRSHPLQGDVISYWSAIDGGLLNTSIGPDE